MLELTDDIVSSNQYETPNGIYLSFRLDAPTPFNSIGIAKCNYAQNDVSGSMIDYNYFDVWDGGDSVRVDLHILGYFTKEEAITMIKQKYTEGSPYSFQYPLAEPIEHNITNTDFGQALLKLTLPRTQSGIFTVESPIGVGGVSVEYYSMEKEDKVTLEVLCMTEAGEELKHTSKSVRRGTKYLATAPGIDGYTPMSESIFGVASADTQIIFEYKEVEDATV